MSYQEPLTRTQRLLNAVRGGVMGQNEYRVLNMPRCKVTRNAAKGLNPAVLYTIDWDTEASPLYDTDNMWSSAVPTQVFARTPGVYSFYAQVYFGAGATVGSYRQIYFAHVQTGRIHGQMVVPPVVGAGVGTLLSIHSHIPMNAGESITVNCAHNDATTPLPFNVGSDNWWVQACLISTL